MTTLRIRHILIACLVSILLIGSVAIPGLAAENEPEIQAYTLDNGLQVLLAPRDGAPVAIVDVWVGVGSVQEPPELNGIAHFFEHMIFKGSEARLGMVDQEIDSLGGQTNAGTSLDWTHYYINAPSEQIEEAIDILADSLINGAFPEEALEQERQVVLREGDQRDDDPDSFLARQFYQTFYDQHPYGRPVLGTTESVGAITREAFLDFLAQYYVPNNMTVIVAGDIDPESVLAAVEEAFGGMQPQELPAESYPTELAPTEPVVVELSRDVEQGRMVIGWLGPSIAEPEDVYAMDVLLQALSGGRGSRFYQNIFKDLGIVTNVNAGYFTTRYPGLFAVSAQFPYENKDLVKSALFAELGRILEGDLSSSEVERAKTILLSTDAFNNETNPGLAQSMGFYSMVAGDYNFAFTYRNGVSAVTVEDIVAVANKYIDPDAYLQMVLKPESFVESEAVSTDGVRVLDNQLRLILQQDPGNVIAFQTFVGTGTAVESPEQAGISALTQRLLLRGTTTRSEEVIFDEIENLGASLGQGQLPDMANLYLLATADTWQQALPIYLDVLLHPAFSQEEFDRVQQDILREIQASADDLFGVMYDGFQAALYGPGGYGNPALGTAESIAALTLEDVKAFHSAYYVPNNMVVSVVGNIDSDLLALRLDSQLGGMIPGELPATGGVTAQPLAEDSAVSSDKESNLTWMILGFPAPSVKDPDYPALKVLNSVLGGGFSSRLFNVLRVQQGLAYSTGAIFPSRAGDSHLATYIITQPENYAPARDEILAILADIQENGVTAEELERAINKEVGAYVLRRETAQRRAYDIGWYEMLGAGIALDADYPDLLRQVTTADVQRVAQEYLQTYVISTVGPAE